MSWGGLWALARGWNQGSSQIHSTDIWFAFYGP